MGREEKERFGFLASVVQVKARHYLFRLAIRPGIARNFLARPVAFAEREDKDGRRLPESSCCLRYENPARLSVRQSVFFQLLCCDRVWSGDCELSVLTRMKWRNTLALFSYSISLVKSLKGSSSLDGRF